MVELIKLNRHRFTKGVVHSFNGEMSELRKHLDQDLFISFSGCSLKTYNNSRAVKYTPLDRILVGTNSPHCKIRKSYHGWERVFGQNKLMWTRKECTVDQFMMNGERNEPCSLYQIIEAIANYRDDPIPKVIR